jgi:hypothetical protein
MAHKIWTAIVGAIAGAAVGLPIAVAIVQSGQQIETGLYAVWILAPLGFVGGLIFGNRKKP